MWQCALCVGRICSVGYDAALYSAATTYYQQQQAAKTGNSWQYKKGGTQQKPKQKQPPKQPQLHYCEVCKISCAGPQVRLLLYIYLFPFI